MPNYDFDPNLVNKRLAEMQRPTTTLPEFHFEHNSPGRMENAFIAIRGLALLATSNGRSERAIDRADRLQRRLDVAQFIGDRILNPVVDDGETVKRGEPAVHKLSHPAYAERSPLYGTPNTLRPISGSEKKVNTRLHRKREKALVSLNKRNWVHGSYEEELVQPIEIFDRPDRKHLKGIKKTISATHKQSENATKKFDKIAASQDLRGKAIRKRLQRAQTYDDRTSRHREIAKRPFVKAKQLITRS